MTKHVLVGSPAAPCDCYKRDVFSCPVCDGGLACCTVCGGAEGTLPTDCPGVLLTEQEQEQIMSGDIDYRDGAWTLGWKYHRDGSGRAQ